MYKYQRTDGFTRKLCTLLYYVNTTTYNIINCNWPRVPVQFHTRRCFYASLYIRVFNSGHPVRYVMQFCTNNTSHKIYRWMSVFSTWHHMLLNIPTILHTKKCFTSACHPCKIYLCMIAHSTGHHTLLHNPKILHTKTLFKPACHPRHKISSTSKYDSNTHSRGKIPFFLFKG